MSKINNFVDIPYLSWYIILIRNGQLNLFNSTLNQTPNYRAKLWVEIKDNKNIGSYDAAGQLI